MTLAEELSGQEYQGKNDAEAAEIVNAKTYSVRIARYVSYRTILGVVKDPAILEAIAAFVKSQYPTTHEILLQVGKTDGENGGVDNSVPETRQFYRALQAVVKINNVAVITDAHVTSLQDVGLEVRPYREQLGFVRDIDHGDVYTARLSI